MIERVIPNPTEEQLTRAIRAALAHARALGVTELHAMSSAQDLRMYQKLFATGDLTARIYAITPIEQGRRPRGRPSGAR